MLYCRPELILARGAYLIKPRRSQTAAQRTWASLRSLWPTFKRCRMWRKPRPHIVSVVSTVFMICWMTNHPETTAEPIKCDRRCGNQHLSLSQRTQEGLEITATCPTRVTYGHPVLMTIKLTNNRHRKVILFVESNNRELGVRVFDSQARRISWTSSAKRYLNPEDQPVRGSAVIHRIEPGGCYTWKKPLHSCFDLVQGSYVAVATIRVTAAQGADTMKVLSGETNFEIVPPDLE